MNKYNSEEKIKNSNELHTNVTNTFVSYIDSRKRLLSNGLEEKRPPENYLLAKFILVKIAYTINSFAQLYILNRFLCSNDSVLLGLEYFISIWRSYRFFALKLFPTFTKCHLVDADFKIDETVVFYDFVFLKFYYYWLSFKVLC